MSSVSAKPSNPSEIVDLERIRSEVVGRELELELILAAVETGRDLVLEGPPGTSKTTLLRAITSAWGIPLVLVEGNAELTPARLLGHHDPARVLQEGYSEETFEPGPLPRAMSEGAFLYFEELNRAPEDTLNALLTAIADRELNLPRVGVVRAAPTFRLIGSMNPYDNVGTTPLSVSIRDRLCRLEIGYQSAAEEREVVALRCEPDGIDELEARMLADAVAVVRMTREHEAVKQGSSVRGAIDLFLLARRLLSQRGVDDADRESYRTGFLQAMLVALSGRLLLDQSAGLDAATVLRDIWEQHFILRARIAEPGDLELDLDDDAALRANRDREGGRDRDTERSGRRRAKQLTQAPELMTSSTGQGLATSSGPRSREPSPGRRSPGASGFTNEGGELSGDEGPHLSKESDAVAAVARELASRLASRQPQQRRAVRRGVGELQPVPFDGGSDEIDLDRTFEALAERRPLKGEEIFVRERRRRGRAIVLAVDISGSMRGERLHTAAATVGALSAEFARDQLAVIAFWSDAAALLRLGERSTLERLVEEMLALSASGLTNVSFPLELAREELASAGTREQRVLLLSDCVHNAGPDPREAAARLPRLDVLLELSGSENDPELAREMAKLGRGTTLPVRNYRDVAAAVNAAFEADR
jgi:MoxR-like ATPase/Mg-chelatase subunit ChlD